MKKYAKNRNLKLLVFLLYISLQKNIKKKITDSYDILNCKALFNEFNLLTEYINKFLYYSDYTTYNITNLRNSKTVTIIKSENNKIKLFENYIVPDKTLPLEGFKFDTEELVCFLMIKKLKTNIKIQLNIFCNELNVNNKNKFRNILNIIKDKKKDVYNKLINLIKSFLPNLEFQQTAGFILGLKSARKIDILNFIYLSRNIDNLNFEAYYKFLINEKNKLSDFQPYLDNLNPISDKYETLNLRENAYIHKGGIYIKNFKTSILTRYKLKSNKCYLYTNIEKFSTPLFENIVYSDLYIDNNIYYYSVGTHNYNIYIPNLIYLNPKKNLIYTAEKEKHKFINFSFLDYKKFKSDFTNLVSIGAFYINWNHFLDNSVTYNNIYDLVIKNIKNYHQLFPQESYQIIKYFTNNSITTLIKEANINENKFDIITYFLKKLDNYPSTLVVELQIIHIKIYLFKFLKYANNINFD